MRRAAHQALELAWRLLWLPAGVAFLAGAVALMWWMLVLQHALASVRWWVRVLQLGAKGPREAPGDDELSACSPGAESSQQYVTLSHGRVRYVLHGSPARQPVVVFLHGVSSFSCMWAEHMMAVQQHTGHCVLSFDFYGHGFSDCPDLSYDPATLSEQLRELLDTLQIHSPVTVVGHSLGGLVAATFAARHPGRTARLCLINSIGLPSGVRAHFATLCSVGFRGIYAALRLPGLRQSAAFLGHVLLTHIAHASAVTHDHVLHTFRTQANDGYGASGQFARSLLMMLHMWAWQHKRSRRDGVFAAFLRHWDPFADFSSVIQQAGAHGFPVLLLWGDRDPLAPVTSVPRFVSLLPRAVAKRHKWSDHNLPLQKPAFVINELVHFLGTSPATVAPSAGDATVL